MKLDPFAELEAEGRAIGRNRPARSKAAFQLGEIRRRPSDEGVEDIEDDLAADRLRLVGARFEIVGIRRNGNHQRRQRVRCLRMGCVQHQGQSQRGACEKFEEFHSSGPFVVW